MHLITFLGHVHPRGFRFDILNLRKFRFENENLVSGTITIDIHDSNIIAQVEFDNLFHGFEYLLHHRVMILCTAVLNLYSMTNGYYLFPIIERVIDLNNNERDIVLFCESTNKLNVNLDHIGGTEGALKVLMEYPILMQKFKDVYNSLYGRENTETNCATVIDAIKHILSDSKNEKTQWANLRLLLNVDEAYLKYIYSSSSLTRHGKFPIRDNYDIEQVIAKTTVIMYRFLYLKHHSLNALPIAEFPILTT